ncbi:MAG: hypothetical protein GQ531_08370 [Sulfurovum sp.]|nr:hypothetical protein [Sulfurovum sp.]
MSLKRKEQLQKLGTTEQKERRSFLKKAAYAAPKLIALGYFIRPTQSMAASSLDGVPCGGLNPPCDV